MKKVFVENTSTDIRATYILCAIVFFFWAVNMTMSGVYFSPLKNPSAVRIVIASLFWIWIAAGMVNTVSVLGWNKIIHYKIHTAVGIVGICSLFGSLANYELLFSGTTTNGRDLVLLGTIVILLLLDMAAILEQTKEK